MPDNVTQDELNAVRKFAAAYGHGRMWRGRLNAAWETGNYGNLVNDDERALLQGLRNKRGPAWLKHVRIIR